jgi:hypothetical protein
MRSFLVALAGLTLLAGHAAQAKVDILVDKNNQMMTVSVDGVAKYHWPVSTGIPSRETPDGTFRAFRMEASHFSKEFDDAPMPHSIFFTKVGHAIHGTESEGRLGTPVSHGCVRLSRANAATLYALVEQQGVLNNTVTLTGSAAIALARHPNNAVASRAPAPAPVSAETSVDQDQYASATGGPIQLTPQARLYPAQQPQPYGSSSGYAHQRPDDGYIYPADGSSDRQLYPAPRGYTRTYDAQAYQQQQADRQRQAYEYQQRQQQYYNNPGYMPPPPGYYAQQPQQYYQPRGYYQ